MAIRVAINGFGRIGRNVLRSAKQAGVTDLDFVAGGDSGRGPGEREGHGRAEVHDSLNSESPPASLSV